MVTSSDRTAPYRERKITTTQGQLKTHFSLILVNSIKRIHPRNKEIITKEAMRILNHTLLTGLERMPGTFSEKKKSHVILDKSKAIRT